MSELVIVVGINAKQRREELGLRLADIALRSGLHLSYIGNLEKGRGNPTLSALEALAHALALPLTSLFRDRRQS